MHRIWKEFAKNHPGKFDKELKIKTDFAVRTSLLENGLLVPVTGRISAGPCGRH